MSLNWIPVLIRLQHNREYVQGSKNDMLTNKANYYPTEVIFKHCI